MAGECEVRDWLDAQLDESRRRVFDDGEDDMDDRVFGEDLLDEYGSKNLLDEGNHPLDGETDREEYGVRGKFDANGEEDGSGDWIPQGDNELPMYDPMVQALAAILTNYDIAIMDSHLDRGSMRPCIGCHKQGQVSVPILLNSYLVGKVFNDDRTKGPLLHDSQHAKQMQHQIAILLAEVFNYQHRTCAYMLYIGDPEARIIRVDRAGIIITKAINLRTDPGPLLEFLHHLNSCGDEEQGLDPTVRLATTEEAQLVEKNLKEYTTSKNRLVYAITVPGRKEHSEETREVLTWGPVGDTDSLTGRCRRAHPVYSVKDARVLFLKDTWRSGVEGIEKESDLIRELREQGNVPHLPTVVAGDDVLDQRTKTQEYQWCKWNIAGTTELEERIHHRLLEDFIPTTLWNYRSPRGLLKVVTDALIAHEVAFKYGVLHRDISNHNILVTEDGEGILTDWELAIRVRTPQGVPIETPPRQWYRTGTWAFISARLLHGSANQHQLSDDLESFFWLVLYIALRTLVIEREDAMELEVLIHKLFYESDYMATSNAFIGGGSKAQLLMGINPLRGLTFPGNEALTTWYNVLIPVLENVCVRTARQRDDLAAQLCDHTFVLKAFQDALDSSEWSKERPAFEVGTIIKTQTRRKRHVAHARPDDDYVPPNAKKLKSTEGGRNTSTPAGSSTQGSNL